MELNIKSSCSSDNAFPVSSTSTACPPTIPFIPAFLAITSIALAFAVISPSHDISASAIISYARLRSPSPASIPKSSPNTLCVVSLPLL